MNRTVLLKCLGIIAFICLSFSTKAQLYDWRGPNRTGVYNETALLKQWPKNGPELLFSVENLGLGYSSATVTDNTIYVTGRKDSTEVLTALSLDGKLKWSTEYGKSWWRSYTDARSTPTFYNGKIYVISGNGDVACVDEAGKLIWESNPWKKFNVQDPKFGISESPLVVDNKLIVSPGGSEVSIIALDLNSGKIIWKTEALNEGSHYVSPVCFNHNGKKIIVNLSKDHIYGVEASSGKLLWKVNYMAMNNFQGDRMRKNHANTPIYRNGSLFVCSGYNHISVMLQLSDDGNSVSVKWKNKDIDPHHGGAVLIGDYLYSSNYENNSNGDWVCVDWNTGETKWIQEWHNKGSIIAADGMLYLYEEKHGNFGLVKASPEKFDLVSEFKIEKGKGPHWSHPVIRDGNLYVRHANVLMVYNISRK